jgi:DNA-binding transcriptional ArsR family regulator
MNLKTVKAVSDKSRLRLLARLSKKETCACNLPRCVRISQPAVSQHLGILSSAGLVAMRKEGTKRLYSLSKKGRKVLSDISRWK